MGETEEPAAVHLTGLVLVRAGDDVDAGLSQPPGAPGGDRVGIRQGVHDAGDTRTQERLGARARPAGVVAGLERDDGGGTAGGVAGPVERVNLGVGRSCPAVVADSDHRSAGGEDGAADARVGALWDARCACGLEREEHRRGLGRRDRLRRRRGFHGPSRLSCRCGSGAERSRDDGARADPWADDERRAPACASHPDFDRRSRSSTWSTGHRCDRVADFHRRFGVSPTPEHASSCLREHRTPTGVPMRPRRACRGRTPGGRGRADAARGASRNGRRPSLSVVRVRTSSGPNGRLRGRRRAWPASTCGSRPGSCG